MEESAREEARAALRRELDVEQRLARIATMDAEYGRLKGRMADLEAKVKRVETRAARRHARVRRLMMALVAAAIMGTLSSIPEARELAWKLMRSVVKP